MRIYLLSPEGVPMNPHLFPQFIETWKAKGHEIVDRVQDCSVAFWDMHTRIAPYRQHDLDYITKNNIKVCSWDEWDRGGLSNDYWPHPLTPQMEDFMFKLQMQELDAVHFCRLMDKTLDYGDENIYPYEKPIIYSEPITTPDELFNRSVDIFFVANSAPNREVIKKVFEADGRFKCNIVIGAPKIPFAEWLNQCSKSKLFIKASGGGYSCERMQALFSISPMILERTDQLLTHPFTHLENCIEISQPPAKEDLDIIFEVINNKERLYEIYRNGYNFVKEHYSKEAIGNYILDKLNKHGIV